MKRNSIALLCMAITAVPAFAEDGIKSSVELGMVMTSGNSETQSTNAKASVEMTKAKWRSAASLEALNVTGDVNGETKRLSEKYQGAGKVSYLFSEHAYSFLAADGIHDPFSGYSYQVSSALGAGYRVINQKAMVFDVEGGPGFRQSKVRGSDETLDEGMFRIGAKFTYNISETSAFSEEFTADIGEESTISKSVTALTAQVAGNLAMKASLTIKNNDKPAPGADETDSELGVNLVYSF